jgi:hypothetical protein
MPFTETKNDTSWSTVFTCIDQDSATSYSALAASIKSIHSSDGKHTCLNEFLKLRQSEATDLQKVKLMIYVFEVIKQCEKQFFSSCIPWISGHVQLLPNEIELGPSLFPAIAYKTENSKVQTQLAKEINFEELCINAAKEVFSDETIRTTHKITKEIEAANSPQQNPARPSQTATASCPCFPSLFRRDTHTRQKPLLSSTPASNNCYKTCIPQKRSEDATALEKAIKIIDSIRAERQERKQHKTRSNSVLLYVKTPKTYYVREETTPTILGSRRFRNMDNDRRSASAPLAKSDTYPVVDSTPQRSNTSSPHLPKFDRNSASHDDTSVARPTAKRELPKPAK